MSIHNRSGTATVRRCRSIPAIVRVISLGTLVTLSGLSAQACGADSSTSAAGGKLFGQVALQDAWGNALDDASGVEVSVDGVSAKTTTDASGSWTLAGVPNGVYDILFRKNGFGPMRIPAQKISGSTSVKAITMAMTPSMQAIIDSIYPVDLEGTELYFIDGHYSSPPPANAKQSAVIVFTSRTATVSSDPSTYEQWNASIYLSGSRGTFSTAMPAEGTRNTFGRGTKLFIAGYATSVACSCYTDPTTGQRVFTNTGPRSNVVTFTLP